MKKQIFKTPFQLLFSLLVALMLVACGGSGGSGSGAPPKTLAGVETGGENTPVKEGDVYILKEDSVLTLSLNSTKNLDAKLSTVDISNLFTITGNKISVNAYALQGIFAAIGNEGTLSVQAAGSSKESIKLKYLATPALVFTKVEGAGQGFDGTRLELPKKDGGNYKAKTADPDSDWPKNEVPLPEFVLGGSLAAKGEVRGALASGITGAPDDLTLTPSTPSDKFKSKQSGLSYTVENDDEADFSFTVTADNGEKSTLNLAIPGKTISDLFALQISDIGSDHVLNQWFSNAIENFMRGITPENALQVLRSADACELIMEVYTPKTNSNDPVTCDVRITEVTNLPAFRSNINFAPMATYYEGVDGYQRLNQGWNIEAAIQAASSLAFELEVIAYDAQEAKIATAMFKAGVIDIEIKANANVGNKEGTILALEVDLHQEEGANQDQVWKTKSLAVNYAIDILQPTRCIPEDSAGWTQCSTSVQDVKSEAGPIVKEQINLSLVSLAACMQAYANTPYESRIYNHCGYGDNVPEKIGKHLSGKKTIPVFLDSKAEENEKIVVSAIEQEFESSRFTVANENVKPGFGFVSLSGMQKVPDAGVHLNALGAPFAAQPESGDVSQSKLGNVGDNDIHLAISSNWINQTLLAAYQSKQLNGKGEIALCEKDDNGAYIKPCENLNSMINGAAPIVMKAIRSQVQPGSIGEGVVADALTPDRVDILLRELIESKDSIGYEWATHTTAPFTQLTNKQLELVARDISLKAWLVGDMKGRLNDACVTAFSGYSGLGKGAIIDGCKAALDNRKLLSTNETDLAYGSVYIDVPSVDIKLRMKSKADGMLEMITKNDFAIIMNQAVNGTFPMEALDVQSAVVPQLGKMLTKMPKQMLADITPCIVRKQEVKPTTRQKLLDAFFAWDSNSNKAAPKQLSLLSSQIRIDTAGTNGDASHIIVGAELAEGLDKDRLMGVNLYYKSTCDKGGTEVVTD